MRAELSRSSPPALLVKSLKSEKQEALGIADQMVRIIRDAGGVPRLDLALNAYTETAERRLFKSEELHVNFDPSQGTRLGHPTGPDPWPPDVFCVCNLVRDLGLFPGYFVTPG